jgi:hypothetical protein
LQPRQFKLDLNLGARRDRENKNASDGKDLPRAAGKSKSLSSHQIIRRVVL